MYAWFETLNHPLPNIQQTQQNCFNHKNWRIDINIYPWFPLDGFNFDRELSEWLKEKVSNINDKSWIRLHRQHFSTDTIYNLQINIMTVMSTESRAGATESESNAFPEISYSSLFKSMKSHAEVCSRRSHSQSWSGERKGNKWECSGHSS